MEVKCTAFVFKFNCINKPLKAEILYSVCNYVACKKLSVVEALHQIQSFLSPSSEGVLAAVYLCYPQMQCIQDRLHLQWYFQAVF